MSLQQSAPIGKLDSHHYIGSSNESFIPIPEATSGAGISLAAISVSDAWINRLNVIRDGIRQRRQIQQPPAAMALARNPTSIEKHSASGGSVEQSYENPPLKGQFAVHTLVL